MDFQMYTASLGGDKEALRAALDGGANTEYTAAVRCRHSEHVSTAMLVNAAAPSLACATWLGTAQGDVTALHTASRWGNLECVQLLLDRGANVGAKDDVRWPRRCFPGAQG
jgi:hypothetical protein